MRLQSPCGITDAPLPFAGKSPAPVVTPSIALPFALALTLAPLPEMREIVLPQQGCVAVPGFTWATFVGHLTGHGAPSGDPLDFTIIDTLRDPSNDNVQTNMRFYPLSAFTAGAFLPGSIAGDFGFVSVSVWYDESVPGFVPVTPFFRAFIPTSLKLTLNQPDFGAVMNPTVQHPATNLVDVPPFDYLSTKQGAALAIDPSAAVIDGENFTITVPGLADSGGDTEWQAESTSPTQEVLFEHWFSRNPASTNTAKGYSGYTHYTDLTASTDLEPNEDVVSYVKLDVFRKGIIDVERSMDDPNFDIAWMRAGMILTRNGATYDIQIIYNGAVWASGSIAFSEGFDAIQWLPGTFEPTAIAADGFVMFHEDWGTQISTDTDFWSIVDNLPPGKAQEQIPVNMGCVKFGLYIKPSGDNTSKFSTDQLLTPITDPAYPLPAPETQTTNPCA